MKENAFEGNPIFLGRYKATQTSESGDKYIICVEAHIDRETEKGVHISGKVQYEVHYADHYWNRHYGRAGKVEKEEETLDFWLPKSKIRKIRRYDLGGFILESWIPFPNEYLGMIREGEWKIQKEGGEK